MNDQDEPGFDDPAYDDVRALLAGARATGPVPDDVVARLDATLAALTADRRDAPDESTVVVPLRRRSRTGSRLLVAAAAVIVVGAGGVGLAEVLRSTGSDAGMSADSVTATAPESDDAGAQPELAPASPATPANGLVVPKNLGRMAARAARSLPQFTSAGFAEEAAAFRGDYLGALTSLQSKNADGDQFTDSGGVTGSDGAGSAPQPGRTGSETAKGQFDPALRDWAAYAKASCPGPKGITVALVPIRYDGKPAALAIHPATPTGRLFAAWSCDGATLLAWTVVPR